MINARAETLTELPSFKLLVDRRRCIISADGFYEWRKERKRKVPMWVHLNKELSPLRDCGMCDASRMGHLIYLAGKRSVICPTPCRPKFKSKVSSCRAVTTSQDR